MPAVFHTIHSRRKKEKRIKKERTAATTTPLKLILNSTGVTIRDWGEGAVSLYSASLYKNKTKKARRVHGVTERYTH
jgi:hypothetical protein